MTILWNILNVLFLLSTLVGLTLMIVGGAIGLRSVLSAGEPSRFLLKRTMTMVGRLSWLLFPLLLWIGAGIWLGQEQGIWRTLISLIAPATILGWILLSLLWREQLQPGALFAVWLSENRPTSLQMEASSLADKDLITMDQALQHVRLRPLELSTESLLQTLREALQAAQIRTGRSTPFERMDTNIWLNHLRELCKDLRITVAKAPLVQNFTLAELHGESTVVGHGLLRAQHLVEYGRLLLNPLWLLENIPFWKHIKGRPTQVLHRELTTWLHAEIYRLAFHRMLQMYAEQDLPQQAHPSDVVDAVEPSPSSVPPMFRREAYRTWGFFWSFALLPVGLYALLSAACLVFVAGWTGFVASLAVFTVMGLVALRVLALSPWAQWLQSLALMEVPSSTRMELQSEWTTKALHQLCQDILKHPDVGSLGIRQWSKTMSVTLQETWQYSADYVSKQRPQQVLSYPALHFYLPDGFLALELGIKDLQTLYNSDSTVASVFRWLNQVGFNPHLDSINKQINPEPPTAKTGFDSSGWWKKLLNVAKHVPNPYIATTAKAIEIGTNVAAVWGEEWWHKQSVQFVVETWGQRMMQLFAHNLPSPQPLPSSDQPLDPAIDGLRKARAKKSAPTSESVPSNPAEEQPLAPPPSPAEVHETEPLHSEVIHEMEPPRSDKTTEQEIQMSMGGVKATNLRNTTVSSEVNSSSDSVESETSRKLNPQLKGLLGAFRNKSKS